MAAERSIRRRAMPGENEQGCMSNHGDQDVQGGDFSLDTFYDQASEHIRHVMHDGETWYSVIDVVGLLTNNPKPRQYWFDMKRTIHAEGFREVSEKIRQLK